MMAIQLWLTRGLTIMGLRLFLCNETIGLHDDTMTSFNLDGK